MPNEVVNDSAVPMDQFFNDLSVPESEPEPKSDLTENIEANDITNSHDTIEPTSESSSSTSESDHQSVQENFEFDVSEMVTIPEVFYNDVFNESKTNRMLTEIMDFENTKKFCQNQIRDVPELKEILGTGMPKFDSRRPHRDLDKDLEDILQTNCDDFLAMKKIDIGSLSLEANAMLSSETPILASQEHQIEHQKNLLQVPQSKQSSVRINSL